MTRSPLFHWRHLIASSEGPPPVTRHLLLTLSLHMNAQGGSCHPSQTRLAEETGLGLRTVKRHLAVAEELGWITRRLTGESGQGWKLTSYHIAVPERHHVQKVEEVPDEHHVEAEVVSEWHPEEVPEVHHVVVEGGAVHDRKVVPQRHTRTPVEDASIAPSEHTEEEIAPGVTLIRGGNGTVQGGHLVKWWIDTHAVGQELSQRDIKRQAGAAKRICESHSRPQIVAAVRGMDLLFPHSEGEPWDLYDLERKFAKAQAANITKDPAAKKARAVQRLKEAL